MNNLTPANPHLRKALLILRGRKESEATSSVPGSKRYNRILIAVLVFAIGLGGVICGQVESETQTAGASGKAAQAYTPAPGSAERKAIMDVLRKMLDMEDVVFVVRFLKVSEGWAWVETDPRSKDGTNRYEPVDCLLRNQGGRWKVLECKPCCGECEEDPDCRGPARYYKKLKSRFPKAPAIIFPK